MVIYTDTSYDYFVRVHADNIFEFYNYGARNNLKQEFVSSGYLATHYQTQLYRMHMTGKDALALKLSVPIIMMKIGD